MPRLYSVFQSTDTGLYVFTTEQGLVYTCGFSNVTSNLSPVLGIYDLEIYDFEFYVFDEHPEKRKSQDERISATIIELLSKLFSDPLRVLLYVCDASDGRHRERQWLFKLWANSLPFWIRRNQLDIELETEEGLITSHGAVITRDDFPHQEVLQTELIDKARGIMLEKYGL